MLALDLSPNHKDSLYNWGASLRLQALVLQEGQQREMEREVEEMEKRLEGENEAGAGAAGDAGSGKRNNNNNKRKGRSSGTKTENIFSENSMDEIIFSVSYYTEVYFTVFEKIRNEMKLEPLLGILEIENPKIKEKICKLFIRLYASSAPNLEFHIKLREILEDMKANYPDLCSELEFLTEEEEEEAEKEVEDEDEGNGEDEVDEGRKEERRDKEKREEKEKRRASGSRGRTKKLNKTPKGEELMDSETFGVTEKERPGKLESSGGGGVRVAGGKLGGEDLSFISSMIKTLGQVWSSISVATAQPHNPSTVNSQQTTDNRQLTTVNSQSTETTYNSQQSTVSQQSVNSQQTTVNSHNESPTTN